MEFDDCFSQGQPQTTAFIFSVEIAFYLAKLGESLWNVVWRNAYSCIGDFKFKAAAWVAPRTCRDATTRFVNLIALVNKLVRTCFTFRSSAQI